MVPQLALAQNAAPAPQGTSWLKDVVVPLVVAAIGAAGGILGATLAGRRRRSALSAKLRSCEEQLRKLRGTSPLQPVPDAPTAIDVTNAMLDKALAIVKAGGAVHIYEANFEERAPEAIIPHQKDILGAASRCKKGKLQWDVLIRANGDSKASFMRAVVSELKSYNGARVSYLPYSVHGTLPMVNVLCVLETGEVYVGLGFYKRGPGENDIDGGLLTTSSEVAQGFADLIVHVMRHYQAVPL